MTAGESSRKPDRPAEVTDSRKYRMFDIVLASDLPLPGLLAVDSAVESKRADWTIELKEQQPAENDGHDRGNGNYR